MHLCLARSADRRPAAPHTHPTPAHAPTAIPAGIWKAAAVRLLSRQSRWCSSRLSRTIVHSTLLACTSCRPTARVSCVQRPGNHPPRGGPSTMQRLLCASVMTPSVRCCPQLPIAIPPSTPLPSRRPPPQPLQPPATCQRVHASLATAGCPFSAAQSTGGAGTLPSCTSSCVTSLPLGLLSPPAAPCLARRSSLLAHFGRQHPAARHGWGWTAQRSRLGLSWAASRCVAAGRWACRTGLPPRLTSGCWSRLGATWSACVPRWVRAGRCGARLLHTVATAACRRHAPLHGLTVNPGCCLQGLPGACARYLGVDAGCGAGTEPQLFDAGDPAAVTEWRLVGVA